MALMMEPWNPTCTDLVCCAVCFDTWSRNMAMGVSTGQFLVFLKDETNDFFHEMWKRYAYKVGKQSPAYFGSKWKITLSKSNLYNFKGCMFHACCWQPCWSTLQVSAFTFHPLMGEKATSFQNKVPQRYRIFCGYVTVSLQPWIYLLGFSMLLSSNRKYASRFRQNQDRNRN